MDKQTFEKVPQKKARFEESPAVLFGIKKDEKIESFENLLSEQLSPADSIPEAVDKMVKAALCVEFGEEILLKKGSSGMVKTISRGILSDSELRRQCLIIADRFASIKEELS